MKWDGTPEGWGKGHYRDVPISKWVKLCRERQVRDLKRWLNNDPEFPYYYDEAAADHAVWFISLLVQFEGKFKGQKLVLSDWQEWDIVRPLFGWKCKSDGSRRFKEALVLICRKNGKSTLAGAIAAYLLLGDKEHSAQIYCGATKEAQARIVWNSAKKMIQASPELKPFIKTLKSSLYCSRLDSVMIPLGRDSDTQDGLNAHAGIIDEYHAHKTPDLKNVIESSMGMRYQPLMFTISTYGYGDTSPCREEDDLGKKILLGDEVNEGMLVFIASVDDPDHWEEEEEWYKANPNLDITMTLSRFREDFVKAKKKPSYLREFKVKRLNIWMSSSHKWIDSEKYRQNDGPIIWKQFLNQPCWAALDIGLTRDLAALALAFRGEPPEKLKEGSVEIEPDIFVKMKYWITEDGMREREELDKFSYQRWVNEGWITTTTGKKARFDKIIHDILELRKLYEIQELAADPAHTSHLLQILADEGMNVFEHSQSFRAMNIGYRGLEDAIYEKRFHHGDDPVLRRQFNCAVAGTNGNEEIKVFKDKSNDRVDGVVTCGMAVGRLLIAPKSPVSIYESTPLVILG